jgi:hypothetical protein
MLNNYSQAWVEMEYNRSIHSEIAMSPLDRLLNEKTVCRPCPDMQTLRFAFTVEVCRTQRRSDGTLSIDGVRFEVPCRMRHFDRLTVRYRSWDLSMAYLVDPREGQILAEIHPQDKAKNAYRFRRQIDSADTITPPKPDKQESVPPLLRRLLADYAATGLPAAYIPKDEKETADVD